MDILTSLQNLLYLTWNINVSNYKPSNNDENFGLQTVDVITYYDEISNFEYNSESREIKGTMPFEWTETNINQTVVHEELSIPKSFGTCLFQDLS